MKEKKDKKESKDMKEMKNLRDLRESRDLSQQEVADRVGVSQQQYQRYEAGGNGIKVDTVCKLAALFHVSTDYILEFEPQEYPPELTYFLEHKADPKVDADVDFKMNSLPEGEKLDGGLLEVIIDYHRCDKDRRSQIISVAGSLATVCRLEKEEKQVKKKGKKE